MLFENADWSEGFDPPSFAADLPVDQSEFAECLGSPYAIETLEADRRWGDRLNIRVTPQFVSPNGTFAGVPTTEDLEKLTGR